MESVECLCLCPCEEKEKERKSGRERESELEESGGEWWRVGGVERSAR